VSKQINIDFDMGKNRKKKAASDFDFVDLFAGIGGIRIAFERAGGYCVYSSENNQECVKTYRANFDETPDGDIRNVDPFEVPDHHILCAGFPCQPFSISGKMRGFEDTRGTLFFNIMKIVKAKKPSVVMLENVKHFKHHDKGNTLKVVLKSLKDEGYIVNWKVLNANDFGLPQNRERIIIVASQYIKFDFDKLKGKNNTTIIDILDNINSFEILHRKDYTILPRKQWKKQKSGLIFCGHRNRPIRKAGVRPNTEHLSRVHKQPNRIYYYKGTHPTLPSQETSGRYWIYDDKIVRKLTVNECYRLMGFPENFKKVCANGNLYRQIGNSVAIPMIEAVATEIKSQLLNK